MDWKEAAGVIVGGVALLLPAIKWLISDWAKKAQEIEKLKSNNTDKAITRLETDMSLFKANVSTVQSQLREHGEKLVKNQANIAALQEQLQESKRVIEAHSLNLAGNIRQLIRTELVELSKETRLIRNKKNGQ